jgi:hypothetical protein
MAPYWPAPECSPRFSTFKTRSRAGRSPTLPRSCTGMARAGRQGGSRGRHGHARDDGLERELKEGIVAAGRHLGWNAHAVQAFVVAVTGRPLETCRHRELKRVLVAYVELAHTLRIVAGYQAGHAAVCGSGAELI